MKTQHEIKFKAGDVVVDYNDRSLLRYSSIGIFYNDIFGTGTLVYTYFPIKNPDIHNHETFCHPLSLGAVNKFLSIPDSNYLRYIENIEKINKIL